MEGGIRTRKQEQKKLNYMTIGENEVQEQVGIEAVISDFWAAITFETIKTRDEVASYCCVLQKENGRKVLVGPIMNSVSS